MATEQEAQAQLDIQSQINKVIEARAGLLKGVTSEISAQVQMAQELCKALDCKDLDGMTERMAGYQDALQRARDAAAGLGSSTQDLVRDTDNATGSASDLAGQLADIAPKATAAAGAFNAFKSAGSMLGSLKDTVLGLGGSLMNIGGSILGAVSSGIGFLADAAMGGGSANVSLKNAFNELHGAMGEFSSQAANVTGAFNNIKSGANAMGDAGVSLTNIYGKGTDGLAGALKDLTELAGAMGTEFNKLGDDFEKNAGQYMLAYKGLGLTGEAMSNLNKMARGEGRDLSDMLEEQARMSAHLSNKFGVTVKQIGANLDEMAKDYATFGGLSQKEMTATAAYAAKLGMEMKDLQGITAKTDDFEGAAQSAAELAGSFGMAVDAMELMNAGPAEKAEMVRQAFLETGKSFEDMSRQEKARMAEITGMSQESLAGALDPANADLGLDEFQDAAQDAADGAITQEEANMKLANSIEKLTEAFGGMTDVGGPFDAFLSGITDGIMKSPQMREILQNFREVLMIIYDAGKEVGKMFMELFPGMDQFAGGLAELLNPEQWRKAMEEVVDAFRDFFILLEDDPEAAMDNLMERLKEIFMNFFGGNEGASMMQEGLKKMFDAVSGIVGWLANKLGEFLADALMRMIQIPAVQKALVKLGALMAAKLAFGMFVAAGKAILVEKMKNFFMKPPDIPAPPELPPTPPGNEESIGGMKGMIEALKEISAKDIGKAFLIGMALVAFVGIAMVALGAAFRVVVDIFKGVSFTEIVTAAMGLTVALSATAAMIAIAKQLKPATIGQAAMGMAAAAVMFGISGAAYAIGLRIIEGILSGINLIRMAEVMAMLGLALLATWGMILVGMLLVADGGVGITMASLGMLMAGVMFAISGYIYAQGLVAISGVLEGLDLLRVAEVIAMLGLALLATAGMVLVGAMLGSSIAAIGIAMLGMGAAAVMFWVIANTMGPAMIGFYDSMDGINVGRMVGLLGALMLVIGATMLMLPLAGFLGTMLMAWPFGPAGIAAIVLGFGVLGELANAMANGMAPAIHTIDGINLSDPANLAKKIDAIVKIVDAVAVFGNIAVKIAMLDVLASSNGGESGSILSGAATFMDAMMGGAIELIRVIAMTVSMIKEEDIVKLEAIGGVLSAVGNLMTALQPPPGLFEAMKPTIRVSWRGISSEAPDMAPALKQYGETVVLIMEAVKDAIPPLLQSIMNVDIGDDPEAAKIKAEVVGLALSAVASMAEAFGGMTADVFEANESQQGWLHDGPSFNETLMNYMNTIRMIMGAVRDNIPVILQAVLDAASTIADPEAAKAKLEVVSLAMAAVADFATALEKMSGMIPDNSTWWPFDDEGDELEEFMSTVQSIVDVCKEHIPGIVRALTAGGIPSDDTSLRKLCIVSLAMEAVANFAQGIKQMSDMFGWGAAGLANQVSNMMWEVAHMLYWDGAWDFGDMMEVVGALDMSYADPTIANLAKLQEVMDALGPFMSGIQNMVGLISGATGESILESVGAAVQVYNDVGLELEKLKPIDVDAVMQKVSEGLALRKSTVTIEDKGLTINMNMNVTMKADDLAEVLVDKKLVVGGEAMGSQGD